MKLRTSFVACTLSLGVVVSLYASPITELGNVPVDWPGNEKFVNKISASIFSGNAFKLGNGVVEIKSDKQGAVFVLVGEKLQLADFCKVQVEIDGKAQWIVLERAGKYEIKDYKAPQKPVRHADALKEDGKYITTYFENKDLKIQVGWRILLRGNAPYFTQEFSIRNAGTQKLKLTGLRLGEFVLTSGNNAKAVGEVPGSPIALSENILAGIEQPGFKLSKIEDNRVALELPCSLDLEPNTRPMLFSTMLGYFPKEQQRRAFNFYLERERAAPSQHFLHYNGWYDFALDPTETGISDVFDVYGKELWQKRNVKLDAVVLDDGWDNPKKELWAPAPEKFPNGFKKLARKGDRYNTNFGIWISPLGGYFGVPERVASCKELGGLSEDATAFNLADPLYFKWFGEKCADLVVNDRVRYFKWDRAGEGVSMHFMNLLRIARNLRKIEPKLYINVTVGTWPSPFWLNHIDSTWRDGADVAFWFGNIGDKRDQWLSYRDGELYNRVVRRAPLYPINSIMHHGIVLGTKYQGANCAEAGNDLRREIRSFFALGPNLQEIYIDYKMLDEDPEKSKAWALQNIKGNQSKPEEAAKTVESLKNAKWVKGSLIWDALAESSKWAKKHACALVDSHWVKGAPNDNNRPGIYATAGWYRGEGILYLRNASDKPQTLTFSLEEAFELPKKEPKNAIYRIQKAYADDKFEAKSVPANKAIEFKLDPLQVLVLEAKKI